MRKYLLSKDGNFYRANLHCHTTVSDGKRTPEEIKEIYKSKGYSIVEVLSACPTNWGLAPNDALQWLRDNMMPYYPLGVYKDKEAAE